MKHLTFVSANKCQFVSFLHWMVSERKFLLNSNSVFSNRKKLGLKAYVETSWQILQRSKMSGKAEGLAKGMEHSSPLPWPLID